MSTYGADTTPNLTQTQQLARGLNFAPLDRLKIDQYSYTATSRSFHLVDKHTRSSLWIRTNPQELPS